MPNFAEQSLVVNLAVFVIAAGFVWAAGTRISSYASAISAKTGIGHAVLGLLLLGGITSLPELAVSSSAALSGNPALAVNNILGGVTMQVAILAIADFAIGRRALTSIVPDPIVILQGSLNIMLLSIVPIGIMVGDVAVMGIGLWIWAILALALFSLYKVAEAEGRRPWQPAEQPKKKRTRASNKSKSPQDDESLGVVIAKTAAAAAVILVAGYLIAKTSDAIAEQTGLGQSFVGAVFAAISTSLPEVSTVLAAVRLGHYTMAISDILGTNLFDVALLFVVDAVGTGEPVLNRVGTFAAVAAMLGIVVTSLFVTGLAERRDRTVLRMGIDSGSVLFVYLGGLVLLYTLRSGS
jgi:cation:H+ antiporter